MTTITRSEMNKAYLERLLAFHSLHTEEAIAAKTAIEAAANAAHAAISSCLKTKKGQAYLKLPEFL